MGVDEVIVCTRCQGEHCQVDELREKEKISMEEYAYRHTFPEDVFSRFWNQSKTERRFVITCQDCGYQKEFRERVAEPPIVRMQEVRDGS
jgi:hypothetical protein